MLIGVKDINKMYLLLLKQNINLDSLQKGKVLLKTKQEFENLGTEAE